MGVDEAERTELANKANQAVERIHELVQQAEEAQQQCDLLQGSLRDAEQSAATLGRELAEVRAQQAATVDERQAAAEGRLHDVRRRLQAAEDGAAVAAVDSVRQLEALSEQLQAAEVALEQQTTAAQQHETASEKTHKVRSLVSFGAILAQATVSSVYCCRVG